MRVVAALVLAIPLAAAEIPKGSHALLRMVNSVSTRTAREGDYVYLTTATPIVVDGKVIVPVGSYVQGMVSHTRQSGRVSGSAELGLRIETLTLPDGKVLKISPQLKSVDSEGTDQKVEAKEGQLQQGTSHGADAARIASTGGAGAAIGGLADKSWKGAGIGASVGGAVGLATVLLTRGREVELKQGTTVDVVFERAVPVE